MRSARIPALAEADTILVLDSDVPWIPLINRPGRDARILHIDVDPLKQQMPLWYRARRARLARRCGHGAAPDQRRPGNPADRCGRGARARRAPGPPARRPACRAAAARATRRGADGRIRDRTGARGHRRGRPGDQRGGHQFPCGDQSCRPRKPGTYFVSGGGSLGWNGGAAIGAKLARPDALVCAFTGDGTYMFSIPSTVHWIARRYGTPFLQVVFNNQGWRAPKFSMLGVHPDGFGSRAAGAGHPLRTATGLLRHRRGGRRRACRDRAQARRSWRRPCSARCRPSREGRCAVIDAWLPRL